jgi:hypothetical protein
MEPKSAMMSDAFMRRSPTIFGGLVQAQITKWVVEGSDELRQSTGMFDTDELLARLHQKGVKNIEIARALGLPDSRVPEIKRKDRALKLDEAVKLVRAFELEQDQAAAPLPDPVLRLLVRYIASELAVPLEANEARLEELTADVQAFSEFVADPKVRRSVDAAEGFFRAMHLRRPKSGAITPPGNDPQPVQ